VEHETVDGGLVSGGDRLTTFVSVVAGSENADDDAAAAACELLLLQNCASSEQKKVMGMGSVLDFKPKLSHQLHFGILK